MAVRMVTAYNAVLMVGFTGCLIGLAYRATIRIAMPRGRHRLDV
jgi:hypothetical protein